MNLKEFLILMKSANLEYKEINEKLTFLYNNFPNLKASENTLLDLNFDMTNEEIKKCVEEFVEKHNKEEKKESML